MTNLITIFSNTPLLLLLIFARTFVLSARLFLSQIFDVDDVDDVDAMVVILPRLKNCVGWFHKERYWMLWLGVFRGRQAVLEVVVVEEDDWLFVWVLTNLPYCEHRLQLLVP